MGSKAIAVLDADVELTPEFAEEARLAEVEVQDAHKKLAVDYIKFAAHLSSFKRNAYYKAFYETFDLWADSPALPGIGWRTARNLIRIVDEAIPLIQKFEAMEMLPSISTMYDMLPILNDENGEEKFIEALYAIQGLATRDAKAMIKQIRGIPERVAGNSIFELQWSNGDTGNKYFAIWASSPGNYYKVATGDIEDIDWPAFEALFKGNVREMGGT